MTFPMTFEELKERLAMLDEVTLLELLNIRSTDLIAAFTDIIEDRREQLEKEVSEYE